MYKEFKMNSHDDSECRVDIEKLKIYVERVEALGMDSEAQLNLVADETRPIETEKVIDIIKKYEQIDTECADIYKYMYQWSLGSLSPIDKSEITYAQGRLKRIALVTKNILRICRKQAGIMDPDQLQEELNIQLMMHNRF